MTYRTPAEHLRTLAHALETANVPAGPLIASAYRTAAESLDESWETFIADAIASDHRRVGEELDRLVKAARVLRDIAADTYSLDSIGAARWARATDEFDARIRDLADTL